MNTSLTLHPTFTAVRQPARSRFFAALLAFVASLFIYDDPAALRYSASKTNGEID
jgi:hypothetical protein